MLEYFERFIQGPKNEICSDVEKAEKDAKEILVVIIEIIFSRISTSNRGDSENLINCIVRDVIQKFGGVPDDSLMTYNPIHNITSVSDHVDTTIPDIFPAVNERRSDNTIVHDGENFIKQNQCHCCIVSYTISSRYDNLLLNNQQLLYEIGRTYSAKSINQLINLCEDQETAEQILDAIDELGVEKVLEIFFGDKIKSSNSEVVQIQEQEALIKTKDEQLLETIAQIEAITGKDTLADLTGWHQYISKALSNNPLSKHATTVVQTINNMVNNLEEWLDFGSIYEDIDVDSQVAIMISQLENMFDFVASGITHVGLLPRYPDFDPDDYYGGGGSNGGNAGNIDYGGNQVDSTDFALLFIGQNATDF